MQIYKKAILPLGFTANAVSSGIKKSGKPDLALFYTKEKACAAVMATTNTIPAAPVILNSRYLKTNKIYHAIVANSGNANAFCGDKGLKVAERMGSSAARGLGVKKESVLVASTGIIGKPLPVEKIEKAMPLLTQGLSRAGINKAKKAIMTTDKFAKEAAIKFSLGGKAITVSAVAKGAGMIAPDMATMLVFIFTDAVIPENVLNAALKVAVNNTFNCITVDGCMSTNDTVICLANQKAGNPAIKNGKAFDMFVKALETICIALGKMIVSDGEGASKFIRIDVSGAKNGLDAKKIALSIANSNLFKTAMFASSDNIRGRIVAACGASKAALKEADLKLSYTPLKKKEVNICVSVGKGVGSFTVYTSDLTHKYIKINAAYN